MPRIFNSCLQDIVELDGYHYLVTSTFDQRWERGYETKVALCDTDGNKLAFHTNVCEMKHKCTFDAVEKGHKEVVSNLAQCMSDYKAKQEEERKKREEEQAKANKSIREQLEAAFSHMNFATYRTEEPIITINDIMDSITIGSWASENPYFTIHYDPDYNPEEN